jgi:hypothetical protein
MKRSTWKITTYSDGSPVGTAHGVDHDQAVVAIRQAMYGHDPLTDNQVSEQRLAWVADVERYASAQGQRVAA